MAGKRADCPECGGSVAVNKDGSLRKHPCNPELEVEESAPAVPAAGATIPKFRIQP